MMNDAFVSLLKLFQVNFVTPVWSLPGVLLAKRYRKRVLDIDHYNDRKIDKEIL